MSVATRTMGDDLFERRDLGPFDGDAKRERLEQAHLLRAMTETPGWAVLQQIVGKELAAWEKRILEGRLEPDIYRHQTGYVRGIRSVLETPVVLAELVRRETTPNEEE